MYLSSFFFIYYIIYLAMQCKGQQKQWILGCICSLVVVNKSAIRNNEFKRSIWMQHHVCPASELLCRWPLQLTHRPKSVLIAANYIITTIWTSVTTPGLHKQVTSVSNKCKLDLATEKSRVAKICIIWFSRESLNLFNTRLKSMFSLFKSVYLLVLDLPCVNFYNSK